MIDIILQIIGITLVAVAIALSLVPAYVLYNIKGNLTLKEVKQLYQLLIEER
jgi:hypothetical protein